MCSGRGCEGLEDRILQAALDYRYLLDRGYPPKPSLDLVTSRYSLKASERSLILRCVHESTSSERILRALVRGEELRGWVVVLDLLNVGTTLISLLEGECLYLCDDGVVRDVGGSRYWRGRDHRISEAVQLAAKRLSALEVSEAILVMDRGVSRSKAILASAVEIVGSAGIGVRGILAQKADRELVKVAREAGRSSGSPVAVSSSDVLVVRECERIYDLAGDVALSRCPGSVDPSIYRLFLPRAPG